MIEYSAGIVTAYGSAVRAGYTGTYEDFCRQQAQYADNASAVEQAKQTAVTNAQTAVTSAQSASQSAQSAERSAELAGQHAESAGYVIFDVDEQTGEAIATVTDAVDEAMTFAVDEANGDLEVTLI